MSPHQVVAVGIRLFAIWLAIYALKEAPGFLVQLRKYDDQFAIGFTIAAVLIILGLLVVLWFFPRTIARRLLPGSAPAEPPVISPDAWFAVGCSLLGLWVLTDAIPALMRYFTFLYLDQRWGGYQSAAPWLASWGTVVCGAPPHWILVTAWREGPQKARNVGSRCWWEIAF